ncbi:MAG: hypothetical protein DSZ24_00225 [Thermodesulfatator sp.]|nr:MAG: hypothetical protein DSZ24_00225 [Thermodesulfatator sp.]
MVAPTGSGKTRAVSGRKFGKLIYGIPLRALAGSLKRELSSCGWQAVIHHGDLQESRLLAEEAVLTTYDQIVCAAAGLPLSFSLSAGHAVAGGLFQGTLVLDEVHLARGISSEALLILFGILYQRRKFGLPTVVMTATLPRWLQEFMEEQFGLTRIDVDEETLELRESRRRVSCELESLTRGRGEDPFLESELEALSRRLSEARKAILFVNRVDRAQRIYLRLRERLEGWKILLLHARFPAAKRRALEEEVLRLFGKGSPEPQSPTLLITTQVAEAGLDLSAPLVISEPAPVDTLIQRAGRCARWFREETAEGTFVVFAVEGRLSRAERQKVFLPYRYEEVERALKAFKKVGGKLLTWEREIDLLDEAWPEEKKGRAFEEREFPFALNLFDRAYTERSPYEIARTFRDLVSVEVALYEEGQTEQELYEDYLASGRLPETVSLSLRRIYGLLLEDRNLRERILRLSPVEGEWRLEALDYPRPGDLLLLPSSVARFHPELGLVFPSELADIAEGRVSSWFEPRKEKPFLSLGAGPQSFAEHTLGVLRRVRKRLNHPSYRNPLLRILEVLYGREAAPEVLVGVEGLAELAALLHDLGKLHQKWQERLLTIDPEVRSKYPAARSGRRGGRLPPHGRLAYAALKALAPRLGLSPEDDLVELAALAAARHHSAFLEPVLERGLLEGKTRLVEVFEPCEGAARALAEAAREIDPALDESFWEEVLRDLPGYFPEDVRELLPLYPSSELFPLYALLARALVLSDREDASGEDWENLEEA